MDDIPPLDQQLADLRAEHRTLDDRIESLGDVPAFDQLALRRLKKRKLYLKDLIARMVSDQHPDIIA